MRLLPVIQIALGVCSALAVVMQSPAFALAIPTQGAEVEGSDPDALIQQARELDKSGEREKALEVFEAAFGLFDSQGRSTEAAECLEHLGKVRSSLGLFDEAIDNLQKALQIRELANDDAGVATCNYLLGRVFTFQGKMGDALHHFKKALEIRQEQGVSKDLVTSLNSLGVVSAQLGDYSAAHEHFISALQVAEAVGSQSSIAYCLGNVGIVLKNLGRHDEALDYMRRSLEIEEELDNTIGISEMLGNIGNLYRETGELDAAAEHLEKSLVLKRQLGNRRGEAITLASLGNVLSIKQDYEAAYELYSQSLEISSEIGYPSGQATALGNLGRIDLRRGRIERANSTFLQGLAIAEETDDLQEVREFLWDLQQVNSSKGNYEGAHRLLLRYVEASRQLVGQATADRVAQLQARYEADRRQNDIDLLRKDQEIQKLNLERERLKTQLLTAGLVVVLVVLAIVFRKLAHLFTFWRKRSFVGAYKLEDRLGSGGAGVVYRAYHVMDRSRAVALKVIREELSSDEEQKKRLLREGLIVDQISHPHIIRVHERGEHEGRLYLAMELVEGKSLAEYIESGKTIAIGDCVEIMRQLVDAVGQLHSKGVLHRDLKPANVMLTSHDGNWPWVKLLDFGLAKSRNLSELTQTGVVLGTIYYFAPECIQGKAYSEASDVYSLGILFFEMLSGAKPFGGDQPIDIIRQILKAEPLAPSDLRTEVHHRLDSLVLSMMRREPTARPRLDDVEGELLRLRVLLEG